MDEVALPDRPGLAARPHRRRDVDRPRQAGRGLHRAQGARDRAGALGEPGGLLAGHDRRARSPGWSAPPTSRAATATRASAARYERIADELAARTSSAGPRPRTGPTRRSRTTCASTKDAQPEHGHDLRDRRHRAREGRPAHGRRPELPRARATRRQALRRPDDPEHARRGRRAARPSTCPAARLWHRFSFDGYGETRAGDTVDASRTEGRAAAATLGRAWPIFAGERGEYELLAGPATRGAQLATMAGRGQQRPDAARAGLGRPRRPPGKPGFRAGKGTMSATPLAWTHAQFVRLAWSIDAGPAGGAAAHRRLPLRRLLSVGASTRAARAGRARPRCASGSDGTAWREPLERHLADDRDRRRVQELGDLEPVNVAPTITPRSSSTTSRAVPGAPSRP